MCVKLVYGSMTKSFIIHRRTFPPNVLSVKLSEFPLANDAIVPISSQHLLDKVKKDISDL